MSNLADGWIARPDRVMQDVLAFACLAATGFACVDLCCCTTGVLLFGVAAAGGTGSGSCMAGVS